MRIGGAFVFGQQSYPVDLPSGGMFFPPAGNYLCDLGNQTVLQHYDPVQNDWVSYGPPGLQSVPINTDGYNWRLINLSGVVSGVYNLTAGSGYTNGIWNAAALAANLSAGTTVSFGAPLSGVTATGYAIIGGSISLTLNQGGANYLVPPFVVIDPPPQGGIQATAHCTVSGGAVATLVMDQVGAGYVNAPNVYFVPQPASWSATPAGTTYLAQNPFTGGASATGLAGVATGAQATATVGGSGGLTGVVMTSLGAGYDSNHIPTVSFAGPSGSSGAAGTAVMSMCAIAATPLAGSVGANYAGANGIWESSLGFLTLFNNNNRLLSRKASGLFTVTAGTLTTASIEDAGFGLQKGVLAALLPVAGSSVGAGTLALFLGGVVDTSILQPAIGT